jgi:hypothetical protein
MLVKFTAHGWLHKLRPSDIEPAVEERMKTLSHFVGTTILGGVLFLTPIVVIWLILSNAYDVAGRVLQPLTALIPESLSSRTAITAVLKFC